MTLKLKNEDYQRFWDNFNVELYALFKQVKRSKTYEKNRGNSKKKKT